MPFVEGNITVQQTGPTTWKLLEPVVYEGKKQVFTVPAGFPTDFASVPTVFVWLIPRYGVYTKAAVLHDFLCKDAAMGRADADGIFRRALRELGVSSVRRWMMWAAVRAQSRLSRATWGQRAGWLLVTLLSAAFLALPALIVSIWLLLFLALEWVAYGFHRASAPGAANRPRFSGVPSTEAEEVSGGLSKQTPPPTPVSRAEDDH